MDRYIITKTPVEEILPDKIINAIMDDDLYNSYTENYISPLKALWSTLDWDTKNIVKDRIKKVIENLFDEDE